MTKLAEPHKTGVTEVEALAQRHPALVALARGGWVAKGIVNGLVGVLAFFIASRSGEDGGGTGAAGDEASSSGAIAKIATSTSGSLVLWVVAAGLALYVMWRIVSILLPAERSLRTWATRAGYAVSALIYAGLAWSAVSFATSGTNSGQTEEARVDRFTADLMERAGGRWLVALVGAGLVALAGYFLHRGSTASFEDELGAGRVGPITREQLVRLGQLGWCARASVVGLVGFFLIRAAVQFSPDEAVGLDGSLRELAATTWGTFLVGTIGVGLLIYGVYCLASAPVQRLKGAT